MHVKHSKTANKNIAIHAIIFGICFYATNIFPYLGSKMSSIFSSQKQTQKSHKTPKTTTTTKINPNPKLQSENNLDIA